MPTQRYVWLSIAFAFLCLSMNASAQPLPNVWLPLDGNLRQLNARIRCDPSKDYTPSIANTYDGTVVAPELGLKGQGRLILEGNQWLLKYENGVQIGGTYSAKTTCRYTTLALQVAVSQGMQTTTTPTSFSLKVSRIGDQIKLESAFNESLSFAFDPLTLLPEVTIETAPTGGRVELIAKSDYDALDAKDKSTWPWRSVSGKARLSGEYHFRVTWKDSDPVEGDKTVDTAQVIFP
jgi:hypothetical protein